jgi:hypothetical protein
VRIVVAGRLAGIPRQGGATWAVLQYLLGLRSLGHDVWFVEPVQQLTASCATYFVSVADEFGLADRAALLLGRRRAVGVSYRRIRDATASADLLLNISGVLRDPELVQAVRWRTYLDLDPGFTQLWHMQGIDVGLDGHDRYATIGCAIGTTGSGVPTCAVDWIPTIQPVVLKLWPVTPPPRRRALTTVGNWRSYGSVEYAGVHYGQRAHSMRELVRLPTLTRVPLSPALSIDAAEQHDLRLLAKNGWKLVDPAHVAATPSSYQRFIQSSWAELGVAKSGYVVSHSGWFSDRSACYLASGRPVLAQDTGFDAFLPTGVGLLAFRTTEEAAVRIEELASSYTGHARAARELAQAYLDSDHVLDSLLESVMP